ncbi:TetR/AcrR family transcriptional regulator [Aeromicrobium sp. CF4.19]|uniref:TetR/AcrR family transcriptional regulator n=1 Tax=Aeromicrobium sp. CF4.19 TaxID=3373082 RepID=UPI003EE524F0
MSANERRAARTREILAATRALFDERGVRDAQIEDIARAVGINRAIIYRHFSGKEELFALTLVGYLEELSRALQDRDDLGADPEKRLAAMTEEFFDFGEKYPAFVDCAQTLLRRRGEELLEEVSGEAMVALGSAMSATLGQVVAVLESGCESGVFTVPDPILLANIFYAQGLGVLNLLTLQLAVHGHESGMPVVDPVSREAVRGYAILMSTAMARGDAS